jgi:hypothetical protein
MLGIATALAAYLCVGTMFSLLIGAGYLWTSGKMNADKAFEMLALLHDVELHPKADAEKNAQSAAGASPQPSFEDLLRRSKVESRQLELKLQAVTQGLKQLRFVRDEFTQDKERYERIKKDFQAELAKMRGGAKAEGFANVRLIWQNIQPKLAKEQIMQMIEQDEIEDVVVILSDMPIRTRAKIVSAFTTDEEVAAMDEIMRLIREGSPEITAIENTLNQTQQN